MSLEAQGTITVVMMLEGDFSNGLHGDIDFLMERVKERGRREKEERELVF